MAFAMRTLKKRRMENKTDYRLRFSLLKSKVPRIVIRKTNRYLIVQAVETHEAQDSVLMGVTSKDLLDNGWSEKFAGSLKSVPAAYLTGILMAKKLSSTNKKFILDLGMARTISGNRIFAVAKGLVDGGLDINISEKVFPPANRLNGEHLKPEVKSNFEKVKENLGVKSVSAKIKAEKTPKKEAKK